MIGAFIVAHTGSATALAVSAALNLVSVVLLAVFRFPKPPNRKSNKAFRIRSALRYVWRDRP